MTGHALFGNPPTKKIKIKIVHLGERRRWVVGERANYSSHGQRPWASLFNCLLSRDMEGRGTTWPTGRIPMRPPSFSLVLWRGELLVLWPEAMGLIILLPLLRDREEEETTWPTGRILRRPPTSSLVYGAVSSCPSVAWSSGPSWPV